MKNLSKSDIVILVFVAILFFSIGGWVFHPKGGLNKDEFKVVEMEARNSELQKIVSKDSLQFIRDSAIASVAKKKVDSLIHLQPKIAVKYVSVYKGIDTMSEAEKIVLAKKILGNSITKDSIGAHLDNEGLKLLDSVYIASMECGEELAGANDIILEQQKEVVANEGEIKDLKEVLGNVREISLNKDAEINALKHEVKVVKAKGTLLKVGGVVVVGTLIVLHWVTKTF